MGVIELSPPTALRQAAETIADVLAETAIVEGERCTWLSASVELEVGERRIRHRTGRPCVYDGDAGIAWALAQAAVALDRTDLGDLARMGVLGALERTDPAASGGLYDGAAGVAVAAAQVGSVLADDRLTALGLELLEASVATPRAGDDVISGAAGLILAMLAAEDVTGDRTWLGSATLLARSLVERAHRRPWGWCWPSGQPGEPGLCGLAHGASGVAWALAEVGARTRSDELHMAVREALRYERSWFDRVHGTYPDLRLDVSGENGTRPFPTWWCHGAAGAGLVRLRLWELGLRDPALLAETGAAFRATFNDAAAPLREKQAADFGLTVCHGVGGAVELFLTAAAVLGEEEHLVSARWLLDRTSKLLGRRVEGWPDGLGGSGGSPGLMTGLAGTLVVLLRALNVERVASVGLFPVGRFDGSE